MAKVGKLIPLLRRPTVRGLKVQVKEFQDGYEAARKDVASLQARNDELLKWRDEARNAAIAWKERSEKVERDNRDLEKDRDALRERLRIAEGNVERLQGWVDAKQNREPRIETEIPF